VALISTFGSLAADCVFDGRESSLYVWVDMVGVACQFSGAKGQDLAAGVHVQKLLGIDGVPLYPYFLFPVSVANDAINAF